ncbi:ATP-binding cassette domain-containing protein [Streptomyces sp. NPDC086549]|uniref:ATP-binding cassette domain-containing protein n=1 Tax=Streptomyces sp. NPDC086549 TaxID=3365752 RepID=UPI00382CB596
MTGFSSAEDGRMTVLFQDFMRYDLTAAENVGVGDLARLTDETRITEAARPADIDTRLRQLPHGYGTLLSRIFFEGDAEYDAHTGVVLSGGQWQRVAPARTLLREDSDLLILDEPSSGLDAEAEHEIHRRLRDHRSGRTSLLVPHRLAAVGQADTTDTALRHRVPRCVAGTPGAPPRSTTSAPDGASGCQWLVAGSGAWQRQHRRRPTRPPAETVPG